MTSPMYGADSKPITAGKGANINVNRLSVPKATMEWAIIAVLFVLLIISLAVNGATYARNGRNDEILRRTLEQNTQAQKDNSTELQLRRYNLDWFRSHEFAELEVKVGVLEKLCRR